MVRALLLYGHCSKDITSRVELASVIEARQRLDSQLSENELVLKVCDSADFQTIMLTSV